MYVYFMPEKIVIINAQTCESHCESCPLRATLSGRLQSAPSPHSPAMHLLVSNCSFFNISTPTILPLSNMKLHEACCAPEIIFFPSIIPLKFFPTMIRYVNILPSVRLCAWVSEKSVAECWLTSQLVILRSN